MYTRDDLMNWLIQALKNLKGKGRIVDIARNIWEEHEVDLKKSGDLFYTWQYDLRWAAQRLRHNGTCVPADEAPRGIWVLSERAFMHK